MSGRHAAESKAGPSVQRPTVRSSTLSANKVGRLEARDAHLSALTASFLATEEGGGSDSRGSRNQSAVLARVRKLLERGRARGDARSAEAIQGLSLKSNINRLPSLSAALPARYADLQRSVEASERLEREIEERDHRLREEARRRGDGVVRASKMDPTGLMHKDLVEDVMEVLLQLSRPATLQTETYAALLLGEEEADLSGSSRGKRRQPTPLQQIVSEEPLRGEGWEGPEAGEMTWSSASIDGDDDGLGSEDSETSWDESDDETDAIVRGWRREREKAIRGAQVPAPRPPGPVREAEAERRERSEALQAATERAIGMDPDSLTELEAVREALFALDGLPNRLIQAQDGDFRPIINAARPRHLLPRTWTEITLALSRHCRTLRRLSSFSAVVAERSRSSVVRVAQAHTSTIGLESFASKLMEALQGYATTRAGWADEISLGTQAESRSERPNRGILTLMDDLERHGAPFEVLESIIESLDLWDEANQAKEGALNCLVDALQDTILFHSTSMPALDDDSARSCSAGVPPPLVVEVLEGCFLAALEPIWSDVKGWIESGMAASGAAGGTFAGAGADIWHRNFFATAARQSFARGTSSDDVWLWEHRDEAGRANARSADASDDVGPQRSEISDAPGIPLFLAPIALDIFTTGRSVGLLNALGAQMELGSIVRDGSAAELVGASILPGLDVRPTDTGPHDALDTIHSALFTSRSKCVQKSSLQIDSTPRLSSVASHPDDLDDLGASGSVVGRGAEPSPLPLPLRLTDALADHLSPTSSIVRKRLADLLLTPPWEGGCGLLAHLEAIQGLFLWRRGGGWDVLTEELYKKMDAGLERLNDPYLLNGIFKDDAAVEEWIDPSLVRFKLPSRPRTDDQDPAGLEWLAKMQIHYAVPWPLTYCFTPPAMETYHAISTLLLQLHRARAVIDGACKIKGRTLLSRVAYGSSRDAQAAATLGLAPRSVLGSRATGGSKVMRRVAALRARMAWILRTLQRYLTVDVLEPRCTALLEQLGSLSSFDDIITAHAHSMTRLRRQCLLGADQANWTEALHEILRLSTVGGKLFEEDVCGETRGGAEARRNRKGPTGARKARQQRGGSDEEEEEGEEGEEGEEEEKRPQEQGEADESPRASRRPAWSTPGSSSEAELLARLVDVDEELKANISVLLGGAERMAVRCSVSARERQGPSDVLPWPTLEERDAWQDLAYELRLGGGASGSGASSAGSGGT